MVIEWKQISEKEIRCEIRDAWRVLTASQFEKHLAKSCLLTDWFECHRNGIKLFAGSIAHHSIVARNKLVGYEFFTKLCQLLQ